MKNSICILLFFLIVFTACDKEEALPDPDGKTDRSEIALKKAVNNKRVTVYHYDKELGEWHLISISENALPAHLRQGGFLATYIPDDNFEQALIEMGYDTPPLDDYVRTVNICSVQSLDVASRSINDLTGIEDFTGLISLSCQSNQLTSLDVSKNTSLAELLCYRNQLTSLNVSGNEALTRLGCNLNQLTCLDVSSCPGLNSLRCRGNQLTALDLSQNTLLEFLQCNDNPSLGCVQVHSLPVAFSYEKDEWTSFSLDCE